ncbi:MAG: hypothetical protein V3V75_04060, partial [Thermoguttaceae bacterium]
SEALLREEMASPMRSRRIRSIAIAEAMGLVVQLEDALVILAADEDHLVRLEAVTLLAQCSGVLGRRALESALNDRSVPVREAARRSLFQRDLLNLDLSGSLSSASSQASPTPQASPASRSSPALESGE